MTDRRFNHEWTPEREALFRSLWTDSVPAAEIAARLDTTMGAILDRRGVIGLPKRLNPGAWSEAQIETILKLWGEGKSCSEIAMVVPGKSRNAVIGKLHRLGVTDASRSKWGSAKAGTTRIKAPKVAPAGHRPPKPGPQNKPGAVFGAYQHEPDFAKAEIVRANKTKAGLAKVANVSAGAGVASPNAVPLLDYVRGCKWPLGERGAVHYCCNPQAPGRTYCEGHLDLSLAKDQPDRFRAREASRLTRFDRVERDQPRPAPVWRSLWDDAREAA